MNKRQKEILQNELKSERTVLNQVRAVYQRAYIDIEKKIEKMQMRINRDAADTAAIYQKQFQEALKAQVAAILDNLNSEQYDTIQDYLEKCYEDGFIGTMYDLQGQGIPLVIPIDQELVSKAIQHDTKLKAPMYEELGYNVEQLKKTISGELARGIANAYSFSEIARNISRHGNVTMNKAYTIARTEGHRITEQSRQDARQKAKEAGADVVKQWDSTVDKRTRETHVKLDGQIRELDEPFKVNGHKAMYPGGFGVAKEDINCRCTALQRARWALDESDIEKAVGSLDEMTEKELKELASRLGVTKEELIKMSNGIINSDGTINHRIKAKGYNSFAKEYQKRAKVVETKEAIKSKSKSTGKAQKTNVKNQSVTYTRSDLDKLTLPTLRKIAKEKAIEFYKSGKSGINLGQFTPEQVAESLANQGSVTSLKKDILSIQKKLKE